MKTGLASVLALMCLVLSALLFMPIDAFGECDAETLDPDKDSVKTAISDYAVMSGLVGAWEKVGRTKAPRASDETGISDFLRTVVESARSPYGKGWNWHGQVP